MNTTVMILACVLMVAVLVIAVLWLTNRDLHRDLDFVANERDKWERRARESGWRFPMEQAMFELQESTKSLDAAARGLADQAARARRNTEACQNLAKQAKGALELSGATNDKLSRAVQSMKKLANALPAPTVGTTAPATELAQPEIVARLVRDTIRRVEAAGGQIERDPKKRN